MDAAEELFAERGYDRTSFVDIAKRSGISRGSIPWHFQNKSGLLLAVTKRALAGRLVTADAEGKGRAPLRTFIRSLIPPRGSTKLLFMLLTEAVHSDGLVHERYVDFFRDQRRSLVALLAADDTKRSAARDRDRQALAAVIVAASLGLQLQDALDPDGINMAECYEKLADLVAATTTWR